MTKYNVIRRATLGTALAAALAASFAATAPTRAMAQPAGAVAPTNDVTLSVGTGRMVRLDGAMSDLFVANDAIADVQVRSANQVYIFGKSAGQTTVYATNSAGRVVYSANVRVGQNMASVGQLLELAMPQANIVATPMNGLVLLTGTVSAPEDVEEAERLVQAFVGEGTQVISRLRSATPLQVMLKVTIAEVSRSLMRDVGVNLQTADPTGGGFLFGLGSGRDLGEVGGEFPGLSGVTSIGGLVRNVLGLDIEGVLDANEANGLVTTLAEPTLTALSGETASFLAGGEFPIPTAQGISGTSIEFKQFGVSLAFTPTVLEGGRISMRVRPEVSEISAENAVTLNGFRVPSLTTRRAETTIELGSGQSFMIGGLMRNNGNNSVARTPFLGNLPILGALFRSNNFQRNETELVIVVTPYLVRPVSAGQIALPTDGFRNANNVQRLLGDQAHDGQTGEARPGPRMAAPQTVAPGVGPIANTAIPQPGAPAPGRQAQQAASLPPQQGTATSATPGFNF